MCSTGKSPNGAGKGPVQKQFRERESVLSQIIADIRHVRTLYNIILSLKYVFFISLFLEYATNPSIFQKDFALLRWAFHDFVPHFVRVWAVMQVTVLVVYYSLVRVRWSLQVQKLSRGLELCPEWSSKQQLQSAFGLSAWSETSFLTVHASSVAVLTGFTTQYVLKHDLNLVAKFAVCMELARFVMKSHSYYVEKRLENESEEALSELVSKLQHRTTPLPTPKLSSFLYYLFAPTLIYRDSYPRNEKIRWKVVFLNALQFIASIFASLVLVDRFLISNYSKVGLEEYGLSGLPRSLREIFLFGIQIMLIAFYSFLHLYHNMTAELLRFSDRQFYREWWESHGMDDYFRKWNTLVQDWLFTYLYLPIRQQNHSSTVASFWVLLISGVVHEFILNLSVGFFFPALFVLFTFFGFICARISKSISAENNVTNVIAVWMLFMGWGLMSHLYSLEYYSRINCPLKEPTLLQLVIPRSLSCVKLRQFN